MTKKELIELLNEMPDDMMVVVDTVMNGLWELQDVEFGKYGLKKRKSHCIEINELFYGY